MKLRWNMSTMIDTNGHKKWCSWQWTNTRFSLSTHHAPIYHEALGKNTTSHLKRSSDADETSDTSKLLLEKAGEKILREVANKCSP